MARNTKTNKKRQSAFKLPTIPLIRRSSPTTLQRAIYALSFALVGTLAVYFTSAATPPSVRFILVCASNACDSQVTMDKMRSAAEADRSWYKSQLGETYTIGSYSRYQGRNSQAWYATTTKYTIAAGWPINTNNNVLTSLAAEMGIPINGGSSVKTALVLGFNPFPSTSTISYCGVGAIGGDISVTSGTAACRLRPAMAHEMGHTFGLQHVTSNTLMNPVVCHSDDTISNCALDPSQKTQLRGSPWFRTAASAPAPVVKIPSVWCSALSFDPASPKLGHHHYTDVTLHNSGDGVAYRVQFGEGWQAADKASPLDGKITLTDTITLNPGQASSHYHLYRQTPYGLSALHTYVRYYDQAGNLKYNTDSCQKELNF